MFAKLILFVLLFSIVSCAFAQSAEKGKEPKSIDSKQNFSSNEKNKDKENKNATETKNLSFFDTVNLSGHGNLYITQSEKSEFTIEAEKNLLPLFNVYVKDKVLYIDLKNASEHAEAKINYRLHVKDLKTINSFSDSNIFIEESFETPELNVSINGFGEANLFVKLQKLNAKIEGSGKINIHGLATEQDINITGAGEFNGNKLVGKYVHVITKGSAIATVHATDTLLVKIEGEGTVKYCGKPNIGREISGKGVVTSADDC